MSELNRAARYRGDTNVYFIGPADRSVGVVKIGVTGGAVSKRLYTLQTGSAHRLIAYGEVRMDARYELALHRAFAPLQMHGEWFRYQGKLKRLIEGVSDACGGQSAWTDDVLWSTFFDICSCPDDRQTVDPWALAYLDDRIPQVLKNRGVAK